MKDKMRRKLKSQRGASIVIAMVVFIIVSMISLVIVQAALTNAARVKTQSESEQGYLNVKSAAKLLEEEILIEGDGSQKYILSTWSEEGGARTYSTECAEGFKDATGAVSLYGDMIASMVEEWNRERVKSEPDYDSISKHTLTFTTSGADAGATAALHKVSVNVGAAATETDFDLVCVITDDDDSDVEGGGFRMIVYFDGSNLENTSLHSETLYFTSAEAGR